MRLSLKPRCTCKSTNNKHKLYCDLMYVNIGPKMRPKKKKRFWFFYPLKGAK